MHAFELLYRLPDRGREKEERPGLGKTLIMLAAFLRQYEVYLDSMVESLVCMMD